MSQSSMPRTREGGHEQFSGGGICVALEQVSAFRRPNDAVARGSQPQPDWTSVGRSQQDRDGGLGVAQWWFDDQSFMAPRRSAG